MSDDGVDVMPPHPAPVSRRSRNVMLAAGVMWTAALVIPAPRFLLFDGMPLSSIGEVVALIIALGALASSRGRLVLTAVRERIGARGVAAFVVIGVAVVVVKLVLLTLAPADAFRACYSNPVAPRPGGGCELSFENLFSANDETRFDRFINFGPRRPAEGNPELLSGSDWNLSFANELRLNIEPVPGVLNVERLPFAAEWDGRINADEDGWIPVRYIGQGRVRIDDSVVALPPSYRASKTVFVPVDQGTHDLRITFRFADRQLVGEEVRGPYATLRVGDIQADRALGFANSLHVETPAFGWRMLGWIVDAVLVALAMALLGALLFAYRRFWRYILGFSAMAIAAWTIAYPHLGFAEASLSISPTVVVAIVAISVLVYWRAEALAIIGCFGAFALGLERALVVFPDAHSVLFRTRGQDWVSYQWFARQILETGSLEGGEKVFFYQPGFRYWAFAGHAVFGDADMFPAAAGIALVISAIVLATRWSAGRARAGRLLPDLGACLLVSVACSAVVVAVTSTPIVELIADGASEYPTWFLIPFVLVLLFGRPSLPRWIVGSAVLATTVVFRPNQGIAAVFLMGVFVIWQIRRERKRVVICAAVFVGILLLPALHNLWYGGRFEFLPTGASTVEDLPPDRVLDVFGDRAVGAILRDKLAALLYLTPRAGLDPGLGAAILAIQVAWVACVVRAVRRRRAMPWYAWCLLAWPLTFAIPAISYDVYIYYPRHIIAIYIAAATAVIFVEARFLSQVRARPQDTSPASLTPGAAKVLN